MEQIDNSIFIAQEHHDLAVVSEIQLQDALIVADIWGCRAKSSKDFANALIDGNYNLEQLHAVGPLLERAYRLKQMSKRLGEFRINEL